MLQLFYDDFLSFVPLQLPQLLDVTTMEQPQFYDDYVLLSFPLADPYDLEEVMDIIARVTGNLDYKIVGDKCYISIDGKSKLRHQGTK